MAKRFDGELKWIDPNHLISRDKYNRVESFFLGLGVVFNDLKGLILFERMLIETYEKPQSGETTYHAGEYGGVIVYIQKLIASTISEFFMFLKKNNEVFNTSEFREVINRISKSDRDYWCKLVAAAHGRYPTIDNLLKTIVQIRSNVTFHYDHSGKILRNAYVSRFFGNTKDDKNKYAYYSVGNSIAETRFYFSDAAVEEALHIAAGKRPKENSIGDPSLEKFQGQVLDTIDVMSATIAAILKNYIQMKRNNPRQSARN